MLHKIPTQTIVLNNDWEMAEARRVCQRLGAIAVQTVKQDVLNLAFQFNTLSKQILFVSCNYIVYQDHKGHSDLPMWLIDITLYRQPYPRFIPQRLHHFDDLSQVIEFRQRATRILESAEAQNYLERDSCFNLVYSQTSDRFKVLPRDVSMTWHQKYLEGDNDWYVVDGESSTSLESLKIALYYGDKKRHA